MQTSYIETFVTLCRYQSFSKTSRILYISQPALTQRIQKLETELGFALLDRTSKNTFQLTPAGNHFLAYAKEMTSTLNTCIEECKKLEADQHPSFIIGIEQFDMHYLDREGLMHIHKSHPNINFQIEYCMHNDLLEHLYKGDYDCVFLAEPETLPKGYQFIPVTSDSFAVIYPASLSIHGDKIKLEQIKDYVLCFPKASYKDFKQLESSFRLRYPDIQTDYYQTISFLTNANHKNIFISNYGKRFVFKTPKCTPLDHEDCLHLGFICRDDIPDSITHFLANCKAKETPIG